MERSQYLAQALASMGAEQAPAGVPGPDLMAMQKQAEAAKAWKAANPGQSYMANGVQQMGQNLQAAPGNAMNGLFGMAKAFGVG